MHKVKLHEWQEWVIKEIKKSIEYRNKEENQSLSDYDLNKSSQIKIKLPKGSGHTFLTAYLSLSESVLIVNTDIDHWEEIASYRKEMDDGSPCPLSTVVSVFELFYAIHHAALVNPPNLLLSTIDALKKRISIQSIVIVDNASGMPSIVEEFILAVARGPVVFLD